MGLSMMAMWGEAGEAPHRGPGFPKGGVGAHHDGNAREEHSRNKLPDPERHREEGQPCPLPPPPDPRGPSPLQPRYPGMAGLGARNEMGWSQRQDHRGKADEMGVLHSPSPSPCPQHINAHLSPKGSRTANLISLPKTWLICGHRSQRQPE